MVESMSVPMALTLAICLGRVLLVSDSDTVSLSLSVTACLETWKGRPTPRLR